MEKCIGTKVMKLKAINEEEPTEKIVGRQRKATKEECEEDDRPARGDGFDVRITCVHGVLMLCSGTLLKGGP